MVGNNLFTANLGDSRSILVCRRNNQWVVKPLSEDQKPENPIEKERIIRSGGRVEQYKDDRDGFIGPYRVWFKYEQMPGLAMSRSFGDKVASEVGISAVGVYQLFHSIPFLSYLPICDLIPHQVKISFNKLIFLIHSNPIPLF